MLYKWISWHKWRLDQSGDWLLTSAFSWVSNFPSHLSDKTVTILWVTAAILKSCSRGLLRYYGFCTSQLYWLSNRLAWTKMNLSSLHASVKSDSHTSSGVFAGHKIFISPFKCKPYNSQDVACCSYQGVSLYVAILRGFFDCNLCSPTLMCRLWVAPRKAPGSYFAKPQQSSCASVSRF